MQTDKKKHVINEKLKIKRVHVHVPYSQLILQRKNTLKFI